jgi:hypothetical protein
LLTAAGDNPQALQDFFLRATSTNPTSNGNGNYNPHQGALLYCAGSINDDDDEELDPFALAEVGGWGGGSEAKAVRATSTNPTSNGNGNYNPHQGALIPSSSAAGPSSTPSTLPAGGCTAPGRSTTTTTKSSIRLHWPRLGARYFHQSYFERQRQL